MDVEKQEYFLPQDSSPTIQSYFILKEKEQDTRLIDRVRSFSDYVSLDKYLMDNMEVDNDESTEYDTRKLTLEPSRHSYLMTILENVRMPISHTPLAYTSTKNLAVGIVLLTLMVLSFSFIGPLTLTLPAKNPFVQFSWRTQGCAMLMVPLTLTYYKLNKGKMDFNKDFSFKNLRINAVNAFFLYIWNLTLVYGCSMTLTSHAVIMNNSSSVLIFLFGLITQQKSHKLEYVSYILYVFGVLLLLTDESATSGTKNQPYYGSLVAFIGAIFCFFYILHSKKNPTDIHPIAMICQCTVFGLIYQLLTFPMFTDKSLYLSFDIESGMLGYLSSPSAFFLTLIVIVPLTCFANNVCLYWATKYFEHNIVLAALLLEPFLAQIAAILLGQDSMPGISTLVAC